MKIIMAMTNNFIEEANLLSAKIIHELINSSSVMLLLGPMRTNKTTVCNLVAQKLNARVISAYPGVRLSKCLTFEKIQIVDEIQFVNLDAFSPAANTKYLFAGLYLDYREHIWHTSSQLAHLFSTIFTNKKIQCDFPNCHNVAVYDSIAGNIEIKTCTDRNIYSNYCTEHFINNVTRAVYGNSPPFL